MKEATHTVIQHLRMGASQRLSAIALTSLGRINVICGRNSSGKSTLLAEIASASNATPGVTIDGAVLDALATAAATAPIGLMHTALAARLRQDVHTIVRHQADAIWYRDEETKFIRAVDEERGRLNVYFHSGIDKQKIIDAWAQAFPAPYHSILIPAKRRMQTGIQAGSGVRSSPDGQGLLTELARLKLALEGSADHSLLHAIQASFVEITDGFSFGTVQDVDNQISLSFRRGSGAWKSASEFGLGLLDLLIMLYYAHEPVSHLVAIEEPESHLHPDMQRRFVAHLKAATTKQYFFATHSSVLLSAPLADKVIITRYSEDRIEVVDASRRAEALSELGYSVADNLMPDLVILVEGPSDVAAYSTILQKWPDLAALDIRIWPLGGDIMAKVNLRVFEGQTVLAIVDKDPGSSRVRSRFRKLCDEHGAHWFQLQRYALENYYSLAAYRCVFGGQVPGSIEAIDPNKKVEEQLGFDPKKRTIRLAEATTREGLEDTDMTKLVAKVRELCKM